MDLTYTKAMEIAQLTLRSSRQELHGYSLQGTAIRHFQTHPSPREGRAATNAAAPTTLHQSANLRMQNAMPVEKEVMLLQHAGLN